MTSYRENWEDFYGLPLTQTEFNVVYLLSQGLRMKKIAERLGLTYYSVNTYRQQAYYKLGIHSRGELYLWAEKEGV